MMIDERNVSFSDIIARMKACGRWDYAPDRRRGKTNDAQKERMFRNRFSLTPQGRMILEIYYGD